MIAWLMGIKTLSPAALQQRMGDGAVTVLDVNARGSWLQARVPGALNLGPLQFGDSDLPANRQAPLVFYCSNPLCRKAPVAARRARQMGYDNVQVMAAGISGWLAAGLPVESGA